MAQIQQEMRRPAALSPLMEQMWLKLTTDWSGASQTHIRMALGADTPRLTKGLGSRESFATRVYTVPCFKCTASGAPWRPIPSTHPGLVLRLLPGRVSTVRLGLFKGATGVGGKHFKGRNIETHPTRTPIQPTRDPRDE